MKKLPNDYKIRQQRIASDRNRREGRRKNNNVFRKALIYRYKGKNIDAPKQLVFSKKQSDEIISFVQSFCKEDKGKEKVHINFSKTEQISALAAVYMYAAIEMSDHGSGIRGQIKEQVRFALQRSGLSKLCGYSEAQHDEVFPIVQGVRDDHLQEITKYLIETALSYNQLPLEDRAIAENLVNKSIGEAMLNVGHHAYPCKDRDDRFWWIMADIIEQNLYIALCDQGIGMPKALSQNENFVGIIKNLILGKDDSKMIQKAMTYTRSSRDDDSGGGLGSRDIQNFVLKNKGELIIISGKGFYHLFGENKNEKVNENAYNAKGTLIQWKIPVINSK